MFIARVAGTPGSPRLVSSAEPASGWRDVREFYRRKLRSEGVSPEAAEELSRLVVGGSLTKALGFGKLFLDMAAACAADASGDVVTEHPSRFLAPVDPPLYRDFMVFEEHFSFGYRWRGLETPAVLYEMPVSYLGNPATIQGSDTEIRWPHYAAEMDYELELGIVIGRTAQDLTPETAHEAILGVTILNDFSARDIQRREMAAGLGPSKGKHFGSSAGPWVATLDELGPDLGMRAEVNGEVRCEARSGEMIWSMADIVGWASAAEVIPAGSLLGTGTANGGSGVEFGRFLDAGDTVCLSVDKLGSLTNTVGVRGTGWMPAPRERAAQPGPQSGVLD